MKKFVTRTLLCSAVAAGMFLLAHGTANAAMVGLCSKCHTMHNSQDGAKMTVGTTLAQNYLLRVAGCVACHSGDAGTPVSAAWSAPIVVHTSAPTYDPRTNTGNTLAGGSFWWVDDDGANLGDSYGHNVQGVAAAADATLTQAPGNTGTPNFSGNVLDCETCHLGGAHHNNEGADYTSDTTAWADGSSPGASYRFLSGRIQGGENGDWEYTYASDDHNSYYSDTATATGSTDTFQYHCALCHGDFHGTYSAATDLGAGAASPWKRHPTDFRLGLATGSEYTSVLTYEVEAPVGTSTVGNLNFDDPQVANDDIVVCTSCHRAHGSPYADMLRWTYDMDAGTNTGLGCFVCHTTK